MPLYDYTSSGQTRYIMRVPASPLPKAISFLFVNHKWWAGIQIKHKWKPLLPKGFTAFKRLKTDLPKCSQGWELNDFQLTQTCRINTVFSVWSETAEAVEDLWWQPFKWRMGTLCYLQFECGCHQNTVAICQWCNSLRTCHNKLLFLINKKSSS